MKLTPTIIVCMVAVGCSPKVGLDDATLKEVEQLKREVSEWRPIATKLNQNVGDGTTKLSDALVEAAKQHGSAVDPFGIKQLLKENEVLRKQVQTLNEFKSNVDKSQLEPGVSADVPDFRLVPIGSISAFAGAKEKLPPNWKLCDGTALKTEEFKELFQVLGTRYGGTGDETFLLPNYQGLFLRGLDPKGAYDPDGATRSLAQIQGDSFTEHFHPLKGKEGHILALGTNVGRDGSKGRGFKLATGVPEEGEAVGVIDWSPIGGKETRPKNIAVNWIIRIK